MNSLEDWIKQLLTLPIDELNRKAVIASTKDPDELLALASNPHVPRQWIQNLTNCHNIKGARQIREAAQQNLQTHSPQRE